MKWLTNFFKKRNAEQWEYGICRNVTARRHKKKGNVQFILWEAGKQGHNEDFWYNFHPYWWPQFEINKINQP